MALTTLAGVISGLMPPITNQKVTAAFAAGRLGSPWYVAGLPLAAAVATPGAAGATLSGTVQGAFPFTNHPSGETILARATLRGVIDMPEFLLVDRLWHNSGTSTTVTTAQTVNSVAWPARDINQSTNGVGVYIAVEVSALVGAGVPAFSMSYTNSAGTAGRTGAGIIAGVASSGAGSWYLMGLDAGDVGVRSIQTFTLSATWTSGTIALVAFRPIVQIPLLQSSSIVTINQSIKVEDALTMAAPRIWNSSVLQYVFVSNSTSNICANGLLTLAQG